MNDFISNKEFYRRQIIEKKLRLERIRKGNEEYKKQKNLKMELEEALNEMRDAISDLEFSKENVNREYARYKEGQIKFLEASVDQAILEIFPEESFSSTLKCTIERKNPTISLKLTDKNGNERIPWISEGKLMQYVISFSTTLHALVNYGYNLLLIDEAFSVSSTNKLPMLGDLVSSHVDRGVQCIIIAQSSLLYKDCARHEIHLAKDSETGITSIVHTEDFDGKEI